MGLGAERALARVDDVEAGGEGLGVDDVDHDKAAPDFPRDGEVREEGERTPGWWSEPAGRRSCTA